MGNRHKYFTGFSALRPPKKTFDMPKTHQVGDHQVIFVPRMAYICASAAWLHSLTSIYVQRMYIIPTSYFNGNIDPFKSLNDFLATFFANLTYASNGNFSRAVDYTLVLGIHWCSLAKPFVLLVLLLLYTYTILVNHKPSSKIKCMSMELYTLWLLIVRFV